MQAKDIMTVPVTTVSPETRVDAVAKLLLERRISGAPVVDRDGQVVGILSEGDLMRRVETGTEAPRSWWLDLIADRADKARAFVKAHGRSAGDVMTRKVISVSEDTPIQEIAGTLERHRIKRVPVMRDGTLVGIVSRANLLHGLAASPPPPPLSGGDEQRREAVRKALADAEVGGAFVNVVVSGGTVHLWGAVNSQDELEAARVAAQNVAGVERVVDHLGLFPPMVRSTLWAE